MRETWAPRKNFGPAQAEPSTADRLRALRKLGAVPRRVSRLSDEDQLRWVESECATYDAWQRQDADQRG